MTKADIVNRVANATGVTKLETEVLIEGFFKTITSKSEDLGRLEQKDARHARGATLVRVLPFRSSKVSSPRSSPRANSAN
jgi:hypothetical protein